MKVLVTGATGFIGQNLVSHLRDRSHEVLALGREGYAETDLKIQNFKPDAVIHLATFFKAEHVTEDIFTLIQSNMIYGTEVLEAMARHGVKYFLNTGTLWQYFEGHREVPSCLYAATKSAFESVIQFYCSAYGIQSITLMLSDTFGAKDPRPKLLPKLLSMARTAEKLPLSAGEQILEWTYISDIVKAYELALLRLVRGEEPQRCSKYTVTSGEAHSLKDSIEIVEKVTGKKIKVEFGAKPYRKREVMSVVKLDPPLPGWQAEVSFEQGVEACLRG